MPTAADMLEHLRRHYPPDPRPPGGLFAPEIAAPGSVRRADLVWAPTTIAGGNGLVGHEIKVTRADLTHELADPTKSNAWATYCTQWWLVVPDEKLLDGVGLPTQ